MSPRIVLVEGTPDFAILIEGVFRRLGREDQLAAIFRDGPSGADWIFRETAAGRPPTLVLLDLDLADDEGFRVLRRIRRSPDLGTLPVVVFSDAGDDALILRAYELGANSFIAKAHDPGEALDAYRRLLEYWTRSNVGPDLPRPPAAAAPPPRRTGRVLLVEDDVAMLDALASAIGDRGHTVVRARDGREALACLQADPAIRLIVLDAVLPVMDGWALREAMKADPRLASLPVVVITAYEKQVRERPIDSAAFFAKPFSVEAFLTSLERLGA
ncbi:MAG TPA: response regulator [Planctomycetota bacterium]|nr:response regulator [Planctomycetota bacterium]